MQTRHIKACQNRRNKTGFVLRIFKYTLHSFHFSFKTSEAFKQELLGCVKKCLHSDAKSLYYPLNSQNNF